MPSNPSTSFSPAADQEALRQEVAQLRNRVAELQAQLAAAQPHEPAAGRPHWHLDSALLLEAVDNLGDGMAIFDAEQRLVYANAQYRQLYAPTSDGWSPGTPLEQIARDCVEQLFEIEAADEEAFVQSRLTQARAGDGTWVEQRFRDGRRLRVSEQRLANGWTIGLRTDVTTLRKAQAQAQTLLDSLDHSVDGFAVFDADDRLAACNRTWRDVHNFSIKDILEPGIRFETLIRAAIEGGAIKVPAGQEEAWLEQRLSQHANPGGAFLVQRGEHVWHRVIETRLPDGGTLIVGTDVSSLKAREASLARFESTLHDAVDSMSEGFAYWDEHDRLVVCNQRFREMFSVIADALVPGASFDALGQLMIDRGGLATSENTREWMDDRMRRLRDNVPVDFHLGDGRWIRCIDTPTRDGGRLCFRIDVTQDRQTAALLRDALVEAEQANHAKTDFLARMSHELRTPLNAIVGYAQLMQARQDKRLQSASPPSSATHDEGHADSRHLEHIVNAGRHLSTLIDDILDLAKFESGQEVLLLETVSVSPLIAEACQLVQPMAEERAISISTMADGGPLTARVDGVRLKQVLLNLLSNAVKYNRPGGQVRIKAGNYDHRIVEISVSDDGAGIEPGEQASIFEPFSRLTRHEGKVEGTGIGLPIARKLVEAMQGTLTLSSARGKGSTFTVRLPAEAASANRPGALPVELAETEPATRVLYVEDNLADVLLMRKILTMRGATEVEHASSLDQALHQARAARPHLILLSFDLAGEDGFDALAALRADEHMGQVPIIVLFTHLSGMQEDRLMRTDFRGHLAKPFRIGEVLSVIDQALAS